jgi:hypothetical protein
MQNKVAVSIKLIDFVYNTEEQWENMVVYKLGYFYYKSSNVNVSLVENVNSMPLWVNVPLL